MVMRDLQYWLLTAQVQLRRVDGVRDTTQDKYNSFFIVAGANNDVGKLTSDAIEQDRSHSCPAESSAPV
jgi:hypothetical protein